MTATERSTDRSIPLLMAAAGMVVAVVAAVLVFGVERPPPVESLAAEPAFVPPGAIAWTAWTGSETCLFVAEPQAEVREVVCDDVLGSDVIGWSADGILVRDYTRSEDAVAAIDPETGDRSTALAGARPDPDGEDAGSGMRIRTERENGTLRVFVGEDRDDLDDHVLIWQVEAPTSYDVVQATAAPGGRVVAMTDTAGRLLVAPADGSSEPRLWTDEVDRYTQVIWQGAGPDR